MQKLHCSTVPTWDRGTWILNYLDNWSRNTSLVRFVGDEYRDLVPSHLSRWDFGSTERRVSAK
ncbi:hypothetical protein M9458_050557, partial [Cirrhinus mrigala]